MPLDVYYQTPDHTYLSCPSFPSLRNVFTLISLTRPTIQAFFKTWFIAPASGIFGLIKNLLSPCFIRLIKAVVPVGTGSRDCCLPEAGSPQLYSLYSSTRIHVSGSQCLSQDHPSSEHPTYGYHYWTSKEECSCYVLIIIIKDTVNSNSFPNFPPEPQSFSRRRVTCWGELWNTRCCCCCLRSN